MAVTVLAVLELERQRPSLAAPLLSDGSRVFLGQKSLKRGQEKGAKLSASRIGRLQVVLLQQPGEEFLSLILRILGRRQPPPGVSVERIPIGLAEHRERR